MNEPRSALSAVHGDPGSGLSSTVFYLLVEFDTAWRHLGCLEDRRLRLFLGYCVAGTFTLLVALCLPSVKGWPVGGVGLCLKALPGIWLLSLSLAFSYIALSERRAAERYRNKINLVRRTLLEILSSNRLDAMQKEGNDLGLQTSTNPGKNLCATDLLYRDRWTTALFMKLIYDVGAVMGVLAMIGAVFA